MSKSAQIKSADFKNKPNWFKAINRLWELSYPLGTRVEMNKDDLIKIARRETGFTDFGTDFWDEPLDRLLHSINAEADLHSIGRFITKKRLTNLLCVRLRAEHYFKKYPEILEQELYPTTVIVGIQRTGTTKLHRMLASDPNCRALASWEALNPAPINGDEKSGKERIKFAKMSEHALKYMAPNFFAIHPVEHMAPEEDVLLLDVSFMSTTAEATMHVPVYAEWLERSDQSTAYAYGAKLLKLLQWQKPAKKWILKTPHHLEFLHLVNEHYNNPQFVWTHRNPLEAVPSFLSMVAYSRSLFCNNVNANDVSKYWVKKIGYMLKTALEFRANRAYNQQFVDVDYHDLVNDSLSILQQIFSHRNEVLTTELEVIFSACEKENPSGKYGKHLYQLSDFGVDENAVLEQMKPYMEFLNHSKKLHAKQQ